MFGLGKKRIPTGAREKIEMARQMKAAGKFDIGTNMGGSGDINYPSQAIPVTIIYVLATGIAMYLTDKGSNPLTGLNITGNSMVDNLVSGGGVVTFTGVADNDRLYTILGRGFAFFLLSGLVPLLGFLFEQVFFRRKVTPFVVCWGVFLLLMLVYLFLPSGGVTQLIKGL
jgi:hypothetical protein